MRQSYKPATTKYSIRLEDAKVEQLRQIYGDIGITELLKGLIDERLQGDFDKSKKLRSPIIRMGGKSRLAEQIVDMFPQHKVFVDLFGGASHIIIAKKQNTSRVEIFNDKYFEIYNLFKVIQNRPLDLQKRLLEMSNSKKFYDELKKNWVTLTDTVDKAAAYIYLCRYSFYGDLKAGYRTSKNNSIPRQLERIADDMQFISNRFQSVVLENKDYRTIIKKYDSDNSLFFVDPPYLIDNKEDGIYEHKFNRNDMWELIKLLKEIKGKFIFTHYNNSFLEGAFEGWTTKKSVTTTKASGAIVEGQKPKVTENIWYNFEIGV